MRKIAFIILCLTLANVHVVLADTVRQQESEERQMEQIEGRVASFDWVGSTLILKFLAGSNFEEMEFFVPAGTKIIKLQQHIAFSDIELDDLVRIRFYYDEQTGKNVVVKMEVVV